MSKDKADVPREPTDIFSETELDTRMRAKMATPEPTHPSLKCVLPPPPASELWVFQMVIGLALEGVGQPKDLLLAKKLPGDIESHRLSLGVEAHGEADLRVPGQIGESEAAAEDPGISWRRSLCLPRPPA